MNDNPESGTHFAVHTFKNSSLILSSIFVWLVVFCECHWKTSGSIHRSPAFSVSAQRSCTAKCHGHRGTRNRGTAPARTFFMVIFIIVTTIISQTGLKVIIRNGKTSRPEHVSGRVWYYLPIRYGPAPRVSRPAATETPARLTG